MSEKVEMHQAGNERDEVGCSTAGHPRLGLIGGQAFSLINFRGPLIRALQDAGVRVYAFAPDFDDDNRELIRQLGAVPVDFSLSRATMSPFRDLRDVCSLARKLRQMKIEVTLTYFIKPVIYGGIAARIAGIARRYAMIEGAGYVYSEASGRPGAGRRWLRALVTSLYRVGLNGVDRVFFLNQEDLDLFVEEGMLRPPQCVLLGGIGVELDRFAEAPAVCSPPTFILAARLLEHKGVREFVAAARDLKVRYPAARFLLLGSPDLNPASITETELHEWQARGWVEWQSHVSDVRPWLARSSVLVLPTWYREGVPRSIQEAMALGRPVITSDTPGCRDAVVHGQTGILVPPRNIDALVKAMEHFIESPALIEKMGRAARRRAEALYDVHEVNQRMLMHMRLCGET